MRLAAAIVTLVLGLTAASSGGGASGTGASAATAVSAGPPPAESPAAGPARRDVALPRSAGTESKPGSSSSITFALIADPQYADAPEMLGRHFRDSAAKLAAAVDTLRRAQPQPAFVVVLGDLVDNAETAAEDLAAIRLMDGILGRLAAARHYVLGNHDVGRLTKEEFLRAVGGAAPHYSFDAGPLHLVVLDGCFRQDGTPYAAGNFRWTDSFIPPAQIEWLETDLKKTTRKTIVFVHQRLDAEGTSYAVSNAAQVRQVLERSGKVVAVFQGHHHEGAYRRIGGIDYFTLRGMVEGPGLENNAFALVTAWADGTVRLRGFGNQPDWPERRPAGQ